MLRSLHVVHASVWVIADMGNLFVSGLSEFLLSSDKVIIVQFQFLFICKDFKVDIVICHLMLSVFPGDFKNDFGLFFLILVVWRYKHELVIMSNIEVLLNLLFTFIHIFNNDVLFLDQKLRVLMNEERRKVIHFPFFLS